MNLFELSTFFSFCAGVAGGIAACHSAIGVGIVAGVAGGGVGLTALVACMTLGIITMKLSPGKGLSESRQSNVGAALILGGAFVAPVAAFLCARAAVGAMAFLP